MERPLRYRISNALDVSTNQKVRAHLSHEDAYDALMKALLEAPQ